MVAVGRRSRFEWQRLVSQLEQSDETLSEFASSRGLNARTLGWWRWKLGNEGFVGRFAEVAVDECAVRGAAHGTTVEVELGNGVRLRFEHAVDCAGLEALASAFAEIGS